MHTSVQFIRHGCAADMLLGKPFYLPTTRLFSVGECFSKLQDALHSTQTIMRHRAEDRGISTSITCRVGRLWACVACVRSTNTSFDNP